MNERAPPYSPEIEQTLLGALLINNAGHRYISRFLRPEYFGNALHGRIFAAIGARIERNQVANPVTLKPSFDQNDEIKYLAHLASVAAPEPVNFKEHALTIQSLYLRRELISLGEDLIDDAYRQDLDNPVQLIKRAQQRLADLIGISESSNTWWAWYNDYLNSDAWRAKRRKVMDRCSGLCEGCRDAHVHQVHHLTYAHVGNELLYELVGLCDDCHERAHQK